MWETASLEEHNKWRVVKPCNYGPLPGILVPILLHEALINFCRTHIFWGTFPSQYVNTVRVFHFRSDLEVTHLHYRTPQHRNEHLGKCPNLDYWAIYLCLPLFCWADEKAPERVFFLSWWTQNCNMTKISVSVYMFNFTYYIKMTPILNYIH